MTTATLIQCRFGSSRLPGKALKPLSGRPMLEHVIERAQAIGHPVVLATSVNSCDDQVARVGQDVGVTVYRGDEQDVLGRLSCAAEYVQAETVIRLTGDCPLLAPDLARRVIDLYRTMATEPIVATNDTNTSGWPDGLDVEVVSADDLHRAAAEAVDPFDREHVTPWLRRHLPHVRLPAPDIPAPELRLSVDTERDYQRVQAVHDRIPDGQLGWRVTFRAARAVESERKRRYRERDGAGQRSGAVMAAALRAEADSTEGVVA